MAGGGDRNGACCQCEQQKVGQRKEQERTQQQRRKPNERRGALMECGWTNLIKFNGPKEERNETIDDQERQKNQNKTGTIEAVNKFQLI